ncbi:hypothetical protein BLNAU_9723 [Blattamonas nauphoetae]|uniref:Uncharacterized protein n=1 Tax=Blattamonas nauphoetae TaxID=2049346 RepID=A0ABQ9XV38_9EUKA|nr:hypothetical protein BLNAU_9723 [Blattamonas nauphoetae]
MVNHIPTNHDERRRFLPHRMEHNYHHQSTQLEAQTRHNPLLGIGTSSYRETSTEPTRDSTGNPSITFLHGLQPSERDRAYILVFEITPNISQLGKMDPASVTATPGKLVTQFRIITGLVLVPSFFLTASSFLRAVPLTEATPTFGELDGSSVTRNNMAVPLEQILFRIRKFQTETTLIVYSGDKMNERHDVEDT